MEDGANGSVRCLYFPYARGKVIGSVYCKDKERFLHMLYTYIFVYNLDTFCSLLESVTSHFLGGGCTFDLAFDRPLQENFHAFDLDDVDGAFARFKTLKYSQHLTFSVNSLRRTQHAVRDIVASSSLARR